MRSWARRILLAATISMALVIFCVLLMLAILTRISLVPAMGSIGSGRCEVFADLPVAGLDFLAELRLVVDRLHECRVLRLGVGLERLLEIDDLLAIHFIHITLVYGVYRECLFRNGHRRVLLLLHELGHALAALDLPAGRLVEVGGELREGRELAVLCEREADAAAQLLDDAGLGRAADARHRDARVHRGPDAGVEEVGLEEDLAVG